ncbi:electron transport complex subunit RsxG [Pseudoalteromonas denitrificans]|uniref:Ion-translocating oxidoreductase complex subunit G n=1 Tax=Pseudoalteromonas denitrificans DSM 6059 TaxID=1123010 RepID=A0A1I1ISC6_9GAMM|nr:electron transport complex subunit RsxG [Pseudoalteromonas denitrificans]SFC39105.1 electron transport complex protein RnfG [Pseudoalteromonas denitrificans DSM 6059]
MITVQKAMIKNGLVLAAFAIVTTGLVTATQILTKDQIALQEKQQLLKVLEQVLPKNKYDNALYLDCTHVNAGFLGSKKPHTIYRARKNNKPIALLIESTAPDGYSGNIEILSAVYLDGTVAGVRVIKHSETPGLGDKVDIEKSQWITKFENVQVKSEKDMRWAVKKDGGIFDQFTGATITPRAVISAVKRASLYAQNEKDMLFNAVNECEQVRN